MVRKFITTLTFIILPIFIVLAQDIHVSNYNVLYRYDKNLNRVEVATFEVSTTLTVDVDSKKLVIISGDSTDSFAILSAEEFQLESGAIYKYEIADEHGKIRRLEINTQKKIFIIKPEEIKVGETSRKYIVY